MFLMCLQKVSSSSQKHLAGAFNSLGTHESVGSILPSKGCPTGQRPHFAIQASTYPYPTRIKSTKTLKTNPFAGGLSCETFWIWEDHLRGPGQVWPCWLGFLQKGRDFGVSGLLSTWSTQERSQASGLWNTPWCFVFHNVRKTGEAPPTRNEKTCHKTLKGTQKGYVWETYTYPKRIFRYVFCMVSPNWRKTRSHLKPCMMCTRLSCPTFNNPPEHMEHDAVMVWHQPYAPWSQALLTLSHSRANL